MRFAAALPLALLLAGCDFFFDPEPRFSPPGLQLQVMVTDQWTAPADGAAPMFTLDGQWYRGTDRYGEPIDEAVPPRVLVAGGVVEPTVPEHGDANFRVLRHARQIPWSVLAAEPLRVIVPRESAGSAADTVTVGLWARAGSPSQAVVQGSASRLEVIAPQRRTEPEWGGQWQLVVTSRSGASVQVQSGPGAPPTLLEVPSGTLVAGGGPYTATLTIQQVYSPLPRGDRRATLLYLHLQETLRWQIDVLTR